MDHLEPTNENIRRANNRSEKLDPYKNFAFLRFGKVERKFVSSVYLNTERIRFIPNISNEDLQSVYEECNDAMKMFEKNGRDDLTEQFKILKLIKSVSIGA